MKKPILQAAAVVLTLSMVPATTSALSAVDAQTYREMEHFMSVFDRVRNDYVDEVSDADLIKGAIEFATRFAQPGIGLGFAHYLVFDRGNQLV